MSPTATPGPSSALGGAGTHRPTDAPSRTDLAESPGPPNPDAEALVAAHSEARSQAEAGDLTGARTLLEDALAVGEVRLGHAHPRLAPLMVDLATIARNLGNLTEARTQLRRAYAIIVTASGPEHATALSVEGRLAAVTYRLGEPTEAYDWHLADVGARVLGDEHPAVRGAQERLSSRPPQQEQIQPHYVPSPESPGVYNRVAPETPPAGPSSYAPAAPVEGPYPDGRYPAAAFSQPTTPQPPAEHPAPYPGNPNGAPAEGIYEPSGIYVGEPADPDYNEGEVWQEPHVERVRRRGHGGGIAVVASLGAAILIAAAVVASQLFIPRRTAETAAGPTPTVGVTTAAITTQPAPVVSPSPTSVNIQDNGGSVTLTWADPSGGKVPFIVAGGRDGTTSTPLETVPPGRTSSTIYGLNINFNYCYTVTAVWSSQMIAPSIRTCTRRLSTSGAP